jgi:RimJ/RimL family protein N-acetyltransferase
MLLLSPDQSATLRSWFLPDHPGPLVGLHVINTGNGACFVDRWPDLRSAFIATRDNGSLVGQPDEAFLQNLRIEIEHYVDAAEPWQPALQATFPNLQIGDRVIFAGTTPRAEMPAGTRARRLGPADAYTIWGLGPETSWIAKTWGGPAGLAASGMAWGAFYDTRLVAVACSFFVGDRYEEIGVATEPAFRGQGLSTACTAGLCEDIAARGRLPSWTTSTDNVASIRVAEKLGFTYQRSGELYAIGLPLPTPS